MAPPLHEAFCLHCAYFERVKDKSNTCRWQCKYCPKVQTSSVTRLLIHLCKLGGEATPCPGIPDNVFEECRRKYLPLKRRKGISRASEEVLSPNVEVSDAEEEPSPTVSVSSVGGYLSIPSRKSHSSGASIPKRQVTLAQATGQVSVHAAINYRSIHEKNAKANLANSFVDGLEHIKRQPL